MVLKLHTIAVWARFEVVAIILHEIVHIFNPNLTGEYNEFLADDYAVASGYTTSIISSLQRRIELNLSGFDQPINQEGLLGYKYNKWYTTVVCHNLAH